MSELVMFYFGPWGGAGHYFFTESGSSTYSRMPKDFPWDEYEADGCMQVGCYQKDGKWRSGEQPEGQALLHHKSGWTAISFWDRSVDWRGGSNSTYFARGTFTFDQMVDMAKTRFGQRWSVMNFEVVEVKQ
jgi:hypothetical protein